MTYLPKVSIVIPAYNASNYLAEAIESALAQTYKNIEIIVVNDGSKDNGATAEIAKQYAGKIRYFEKENGGSSSALNRGIAEMNGDWFSWLSHDDLYYPEKIEKQIAFLNRFPADNTDIKKHILFGGYELINEIGTSIYKPSKSNRNGLYHLLENMKNNCYLVAEAGSKFTFHGCSCLIHKSVFADIGGFDENLRLVNDVDMWLRIFMNHYCVHCIPEIIVQGRVHSKQISAGIGFSYHNPEQDIYWNKLLMWLLNEERSAEDRNSALYLFAKSAYSKTRKEEACVALHASLKGESALNKCAKYLAFVLFYAKTHIKNFLKTIYRKLFFNKRDT